MSHPACALPVDLAHVLAELEFTARATEMRGALATTSNCTAVRSGAVDLGTAEAVASTWLTKLMGTLSGALDDATYTPWNCQYGVRVVHNHDHNEEHFYEQLNGSRSHRHRITRCVPWKDKFDHVTIEAPLELKEPLQPPNHLRYAALQPMPICGRDNEYMQVLGELHTRGSLKGFLTDGSKWYCGLTKLANLRANAHLENYYANAMARREASSRMLPGQSVDLPVINIVSIGSQNNYVFETNVHAFFHGHVRIHTFDCTVRNPMVPARIASVTTFHRVCLGAWDEPDPSNPSSLRTMRWKTMVRYLREGSGGGTTMTGPIEMLKLDCEGCEKAVLWEMLTALNNDLPHQMAIELHSIAMYRDGEVMTYAGSRRVSAGEFSTLALQWHHRGYRLVYREDNPPAGTVCPCGGAEEHKSCCATEVTLVRVIGC